MHVEDMTLEEAREWRRELLNSDRTEQQRWDLEDIENRIAELEAEDPEINAAIEVLSKTDRFSVKDNHLDDWIA
ncbi:hypothetical protein SEA_KALNOKY_86 [Mycobacterium phage Kalnoky]|nr:hypothetical protein SEA_PHRANNY_78 [Mycobacterium phage Phranny]AXH44132.1 hypothetical protein SEA_KALNOKY_86 [Mycobacterium phage Kalnoky]AXH44540.1 hypothetical protein SEA_MARIUS_86 [Mycobacterium phage Marius]AXH44710.1 hypothetical protein SEA_PHISHRPHRIENDS_82 [Mycobacterium phage PhishRPhriends]AXH44857.1 hypothetical protein SEA_REBA_81 [Mycobacterium phage Reba]AZF96854.1 hypothetical protein SEA_KALB97_86 [Mycobacterium Phage Kalb97]QAY03009.1 hypothetical protein SEA_GEMMA_83 